LAAADVQGFRSTDTEPASSSGYTNSLYVYPLRLGYPKAKNLAVRIALCNLASGDSLVNPLQLDAWGGNAGGNRSSSYVTAVHSQTKLAVWSDEARMELPISISLSNRAYLLFTVLEISAARSASMCCSAPTAGTVVEKTLGYAVLPLLCDSDSPSKDHLLEDGVYSLTVSETILTESKGSALLPSSPRVVREYFPLHIHTHPSL
jgi:hypothetical protein